MSSEAVFFVCVFFVIALIIQVNHLTADSPGNDYTWDSPSCVTVTVIIIHNQAHQAPNTPVPNQSPPSDLSHLGRVLYGYL